MKYFLPHTNPLCMAWDGSCISSLTAGGGEVQFTFVLSFISTLSGGTWGVGCDHDALLKWKAPTSWPYHPVCYWLQTNSLCKRPSATGGLYFGRALNNHCCDLSHIDCAIRLSFTPTWFGSLNVFSIGLWLRLKRRDSVRLRKWCSERSFDLVRLNGIPTKWISSV